MKTILELATSLAKPAKILVVDDDQAILNIVPLCLKRMDLAFDVVSTIDAAADRLKESKYDLVILDLFMPGRTGLDLLHEIKTMEFPVPVVLITGFPDSEIAQIAMDLGACGVIRKPFDCKSLAIDVARILDLFKVRYDKAGVDFAPGQSLRDFQSGSQPEA